MKNRHRALAVFVFLLLLLQGCAPFNIKARISAALDMDLSQGTEISYEDSHGGFHGDGVLYCGLKFPDGKIEKEMEENSRWRPLPLKEDMKNLLYGQENKEGKPYLPEMSRGYYFFYDRHAESKDPYDDTDVMQRYSYNLTVAIYDTDTNTLHYIELDT